MSIQHIVMAIIIAFIWGTNFVAIKLSYAAFTPFALLFIRFVFSVLPWVFFIPKPHTGWKNIIAISCFLWIGQFSFLFLGIYMGASPGIASLVLQSQAIFTPILSIIYLHYRPHRSEIIGLTVALVGIILITVDRLQGDSFHGLLMIFPAALCVSCAHIVMNKSSHKGDHPLSMVVWSSLIPPIPMLMASLFFEGLDAIPRAFATMNGWVVGSIGYTVYLSTLVATGMWAFLLRHHNPSIVVPYLLLIPIFGMGASYISLGERYSALCVFASCLILTGLAINQYFKTKITRLLQQKQSIAQPKS